MLRIVEEKEEKADLKTRMTSARQQIHAVCKALGEQDLLDEHMKISFTTAERALAAIIAKL